MVGLGNPGARYAKTRHNVGFRVLARLAERHGLAIDEERFGAAFGRGTIGDSEVGLLAPLGFMNRSGESVAAALRGLAIAEPASDLLIAYDEVDLPFGRLRLRPGGGAGGHRGLADVLARCEREDLPRLRFGVGRPEGPIPTDRWVLAPFAPEEEQALPALLERAAHAAECFLAEGVEAAMNRFNAAA